MSSVSKPLLHSIESWLVYRDPYNTVDFFGNPAITTWDEKNLVNDGVIHLSTGAGFLPSTVACYNPYIHMGSKWVV